MNPDVVIEAKRKATARKRLLERTILNNRYIPHKPTPKQSLFLTDFRRELLYGGSAGGGKTDALLMSALQYVEFPTSHALLLRKTFPDLNLQGSMMPRLAEWLRGTPAEYMAGLRRWQFPSGASINFGHLDHEQTKYRYQSSEFTCIEFDELTQFTESQYSYLFSRLRSSISKIEPKYRIPLRMRSATNPGNRGHKWVKERFHILKDRDGNPLWEGRERGFIPALLTDNPHLNEDEYKESLFQLDPITRAQLLMGDWEVRKEGGLFDRDWLEMIDERPKGDSIIWVRAWDLAATKVNEKGTNDPDYTAGALIGYDFDDDSAREYIVADIRTIRGTPKEVEDFIKQTANADGRETMITIEEEGGASGKLMSAHYEKKLKGYAFYPIRKTMNKVECAKPVSSAMERGGIQCVRGNWNQSWFDEMEAFPIVTHDDQIDAVSQGFMYLSDYEPILLA
jgi:predicted phage terminase large subunit-like protein